MKEININQIYEYKDNQYKILGQVKMKIPASFLRRFMSLLSPSSQMSMGEAMRDKESGKSGWYPAVIYSAVEGHAVYVREQEEFLSKFNKWVDPSVIELPLEV